jgi:hypothetical protein
VAGYNPKKFRPDGETGKKESGCKVLKLAFWNWRGLVRKQLPHSYLLIRTLFFASVAGYSPKLAGYSPKSGAADAEKH